MSTTAQSQETRIMLSQGAEEVTQADLATFTVPQLLGEFNHRLSLRGAQPIAKFSDRKSAERRTWAAMGDSTPTPTVTEEVDEETTQDSSANEATDPRETLVLCASCGTYQPKRTMESVGANWYCSDEDACEERITNGGKAIIKAAKEVSKKEKVAKPTTANSRNKYNDNDRIMVLVAENPKRKGTASYDRFQQYHSINTVADALRDGITRADLIWDVKHGFISIHSQEEV